MLLRLIPQAFFPALFLACLIILIVHRYDTHMVKAQQDKNTIDHQASASLFDFLSNIKTIITLRVQQKSRLSFSHILEKLQEPMMRFAKIQETKRFFMDILVKIL
jgi:ABC-type bacteriocin/lantibiotic exporter with double-glycine peptidase domain